MNDPFFYIDEKQVRGPLALNVLDAAVNAGRLLKTVHLSRDRDGPWAPWELVKRCGYDAFRQNGASTANSEAVMRQAMDGEFAEEYEEATIPAPHVPLGMPVPVAMTGGKRYKVLTQKDKWFSGKFDPAVLEQALNQLAAEGWRVVSMASASREGFVTGSGKDELIVLLERDV